MKILTNSVITRTYSELIEIPTYLGRFNYLKLDGHVAEETFGFDRYLNQKFYRSVEWRRVRDYVIARDLGCDLAYPGYEIYSKICWISEKRCWIRSILFVLLILPTMPFIMVMILFCSNHWRNASRGILLPGKKLEDFRWTIVFFYV